MPVSTHFGRDALLPCPHCRVNLCRQELYDLLEQFRAAVGKPVVILSGYRCLVHNNQVGGAPRSQHLLGRAADVRVEGMFADQLEALARTCPLVRGLGRDDYRNFIHLDCREGETSAYWCYDTKGGQCAYYPPVLAKHLL